MSEQNEQFFEFLDTVDSRFQTTVKEINDLFIQGGCVCEIKSAKNGFVVSYVLKKPKRTIANFVMRKAGVLIRLYADRVNEYADFLETLPDQMKNDIKKAAHCKRLLNPDDCNSRCKMGYTFLLDGEEQKKCRYNAFFFLINDTSSTAIKEFVSHELNL